MQSYTRRNEAIFHYNPAVLPEPFREPFLFLLAISARERAQARVATGISLRDIARDAEEPEGTPSKYRNDDIG